MKKRLSILWLVASGLFVVSGVIELTTSHPIRSLFPFGMAALFAVFGLSAPKRARDQGAPPA
jgi:hypothetical protein